MGNKNRIYTHEKLLTKTTPSLRRPCRYQNWRWPLSRQARGMRGRGCGEAKKLRTDFVGSLKTKEGDPARLTWARPGPSVTATADAASTPLSLSPCNPFHSPRTESDEAPLPKPWLSRVGGGRARPLWFPQWEGGNSGEGNQGIVRSREWKFGDFMGKGPYSAHAC